MENNTARTEPISYIRQPDPDHPEAYLRFPALLISDTQAYVMRDDQLEFCVVSPSYQPNEYRVVSISEPCFYVGSDERTVFYDLMSMTLIEFSRKYSNLSLYEKSRRHLIDARWKQGLTIREMAEHLGMSEHDYLCVEQGTNTVAVEIAKRIANVLKSKVEELF